MDQLKIQQRAEEDRKLVAKLLEMSEDIQIGGDIQFRRLAAALHKGLMNAKTRKAAVKLLEQANKLLFDLSDATDGIEEIDHQYLYSTELENQR